MKWCVDRGVPGVVAASGMATSVLILGPLLLRRTPTHPFLVWNLALAWVPFIAAIGVDVFVRRRHYVATAGSCSPRRPRSPPKPCGSPGAGEPSE